MPLSPREEFQNELGEHGIAVFSAIDAFPIEEFPQRAGLAIDQRRSIAPFRAQLR